MSKAKEILDIYEKGSLVDKVDLNEMAHYDRPYSGIDGLISINPIKRHENRAYYFTSRSELGTRLEKSCLFYFTINKDHLIFNEVVKGIPTLSIKKKVAAFVWKNRKLFQQAWGIGEPLLASEMDKLLNQVAKVSKQDTNNIKIQGDKWYL